MRDPRVAGLAIALAALVAGRTGPEGPAGRSSAGAGAGRVVVDGSSTVFRISRVVSEGYSKENPDVTVVVNVQGTGGGFRNYLAGKTDVVDASRPANKAEAEKIDADPALACTRFVVGYDGITVVVNPKNDFVKALSVPQLKALWSPGSKVKTWKDLDPGWPAREIKLYCPDTASGTFDFFTEKVNGKEKAQRQDVNASPDDNVLVNGVAGDLDGLGYFGYAYYQVNATKVKAVPVKKDAAAGPVLPTHETILGGTYAPLSRPLFIYVKNASLKQPATGGFVKYYLDGAARFAEKGGYVAPTEADQAANQKGLDAALGGAGVAAR